MSGTESGQREVVFVSYSRKDADWRDRFLVMLAPVLERELEVWSDQREVIGEKWRPQLEQAIRRSRAALLLVSPDFVASQFIMKQENCRRSFSRATAPLCLGAAVSMAEEPGIGGGAVGTRP